MESYADFKTTNIAGMRVMVDLHKYVDSLWFDPSLVSGDAQIRIMRGKRCHAMESALQEWAAALQFPYYVGGERVGFDSFNALLGELNWEPLGHLRAITLIQTHADELFMKEKGRRSTFFDILKSTLRIDRSGFFFSSGERDGPEQVEIILHCELDRLLALSSILAESGIMICR